MPDGGAVSVPLILAAVSAATAVAGTAYTVVNSENQNQKADDAAKQQKAQQDQLIKDQKDQQAQAAGQAQSAQMQSAALTKQRMLAANYSGSQGTILTGPLGTQGQQSQNTNPLAPGTGAAPSPASGKTLLGM